MLVPTERRGSDGLTGFSSTGSLATARSSFGAAWLDMGSLISAFMAGRPAGFVQSQPGVIARCGLRTRLPDVGSRAELAGAPRALRCRQGCRYSGASARGRGIALDQCPADTNGWLDRAVLSALSRLLPAPFGGCGWCHRNAAALARPTRRSPLDLPAPTTRSTICRTTYPSSRPAHGPRGSPPGYSRIHGEMVGLGHVLAASTVLKDIWSAGLVDDGHGADLGPAWTTRCPRSARAQPPNERRKAPWSAQARPRSGSTVTP